MRSGSHIFVQMRELQALDPQEGASLCVAEGSGDGIFHHVVLVFL